MSGVKTEIVASDEGGVRVDRWFKRHYPGLSHGALEKLLRTGQVRVDGGRVKASDRLAVGAALRIPPMPSDAETTPVRKTDAPLNQSEKIAAEDLVIHMDSEIIILNKPPGLASQGGPGITRLGCVSTATSAPKDRSTSATFTLVLPISMTATVCMA